MKILHLVTAVDDAGRVGGVAEVAVAQAAVLRELGHDVTIYASWLGCGRPPTQLRGTPAVLVHGRLPFGHHRLGLVLAPQLLMKLNAAASSFDIAHVHLCRDFVTAPGATLIRRAGVPVLAQSHGMLTPPRNSAFRLYDQLLLRRAMSVASMNLVLWPAEEPLLRSIAGSAVHAVQIHNAVDVGGRRWADPATPIVLFAARLHARKQPCLFIDMAAAVHRVRPDVRFVVVGPDQGEGATVIQRINDLGLTEVVELRGAMPREKLLDVMAASTIYVLPSLDEPFPLTAVEAMTIGVPTVLTTQSGISGLAAHKDAAVVAEPMLEQTVTAVLGLLGDRDARGRLGGHARLLAKEKFSLPSLGAALVAAYQTVTRSVA